jgi:hypothetical protein
MPLLTAFTDHASFETEDGGAVRLKKRLEYVARTAVPSSG